MGGEETWCVQECRRRQAPSEISSGSPDGISVGRLCAKLRLIVSFDAEGVGSTHSLGVRAVLSGLAARCSRHTGAESRAAPLGCRRIKDNMNAERGIDRPVEAEAASDVTRQSFAEVAARLVDIRGVAKPPIFSGREADWADFKFRLEAIAELLGCEDVMSEQRGEDEGRHRPGADVDGGA